jgi:hypothetical protein
LSIVFWVFSFLFFSFFLLFSFFLEKKRNKKFKENTTAPRVFPGSRSAKASRLQFAYIMDWRGWWRFVCWDGGCFPCSALILWIGFPPFVRPTPPGPWEMICDVCCNELFVTLFKL